LRPAHFLAFKKMVVGKLGKFKLKYQGKHVILLCLNLYSQC
jgi:hypothetical protein